MRKKNEFFATSFRVKVDFRTQNKHTLCDCKEMSKKHSAAAVYANRTSRVLSLQPPVNNPPSRSGKHAVGTLLSDGYTESADETFVPIRTYTPGYLSVWVIYAATAFPLMWIVARYFSNTWFAPTGLDFGVALALITGLFGRRYLSTEAVITAFVGALAFVHGIERGLFALSGLIIAIFGALLLTLIVGGIVFVVNSIQRPQHAEFDPRFNETDPGLLPRVPLAYRSLLYRLERSQDTLRRDLFVVGPLFVLGMLLHLVMQGASLIFGDTFGSHELLTIAARAMAGGTAGGLLGWLQHQFIPDAPAARTNT